jgi:hypothetical protein
LFILSFGLFYKVDPQVMKDIIEKSRVFCYFLVGKFIEEEEGFYTRPNLHENLTSIFSHVQYLNPQHQVEFLKHVLNPLIDHTREAFYPMILPMIYDALIIIFRSLIESWQEYLVLKEKQANDKGK